jgi:hypothetical protein
LAEQAEPQARQKDERMNDQPTLPSFEELAQMLAQTGLLPVPVIEAFSDDEWALRQDRFRKELRAWLKDAKAAQAKQRRNRRR